MKQLDLPLNQPNSPAIGELIPQLRAITEQFMEHIVDIQRALCYDVAGRTVDHFVAGVLEGRYHFYPLRNGFIIMTVRNTDMGRVYATELAGGDLQEIKDHAPTVEMTARKLDCKAVVIEGRRGWERAMKDIGYRFGYVTLFKEL